MTPSAAQYKFSDSIEQAYVAIDAVHHAHERGDANTRSIAVLVSVLAAILALAGAGERSAQNSYPTYHVTASDDWAFYQAKNVRALMHGTEADIQESLLTATDPAAQTRIKTAREYEARMRDDPKAGDGMNPLWHLPTRHDRPTAP